MDNKKFIKDGYLEYKNLLSKTHCKNINNEILKLRNINKDIFFKNKKEYFKNKHKKTKPKNILNKFNLDFIFKNKKFRSKVE